MVWEIVFQPIQLDNKILLLESFEGEKRRTQTDSRSIQISLENIDSEPQNIQCEPQLSCV